MIDFIAKHWEGLASVLLSVVSIGIAICSARSTSKDTARQIASVKELGEIQAEASLLALDLELQKVVARLYAVQEESKNIKERTDRALRDVPTWNNPYLNYILLNNFDFSLPHFAKAENFETIKRNIDALEIKRGTINDVAKESGIKFDCYNLSDIFEYMDETLFKNIAEQLLSSANIGAKFCYWNMMVDRKISDILPENFECKDELSKNLYFKDKAFFYKAFFVDEVIKND